MQTVGSPKRGVEGGMSRMRNTRPKVLTNPQDGGGWRKRERGGVLEYIPYSSSSVRRGVGGKWW